MKKTKTIYFLIIWFMWAVGKDGEILYRFETTTDYFAFSNAGISVLFFVFAGLVLILNFASLVFLIRPKALGVYVALSALLAALTQNIVTIAISLSDIEGLRQAYIISRESRGLPIREEFLYFIFSAMGIGVTFGAMLLFYLLIAFLIYRNKNYFSQLVASSA